MPKKPNQPKRVPTGDYPVGFARPPSEHNFPKGKTGNPKGRPRKDPEAPIINPDDLADLVTNPMQMMKNGAPKKLSPIEARAHSMLMKALNQHSIRAIKFILDRAFKHGLIKLRDPIQSSGVLVIPRMQDIPDGMEWELAYVFGVPKNGKWSQEEIEFVRPRFELKQKQREAELKQRIRDELALEKKYGK